ncbi:IclR family transcriptional regulator [Amycolatopsis nigrescens]|uniref:IclR family transcriptional regulator n=1 Tax=Amycolatopsis nigrescens TaxID=381445 RepID=UPI00036A523C|nr:helix-turn-helix domain-containing protein [Amycolatopsis nigrescens]
MTSEISEVSKAPARRSPPTERVVRLLDFFVANGGAGFGLSELARELGLSKPTCLGIVTELSAGGYLVRDPVHKTYRLGPGLIAAGRLAQDEFAAAALAGPRLAELSERYGTTCTASAVTGGQIVVLESAGPRGKTAVQVGQRYPFAPPVGLMYVLWGPDSGLTDWLAKPPILPMSLDRKLLRRVVTECRARGYLAESLTAAGQRLHKLMSGVAAYDLPDELRELVGELVSSLGERVYLDAELSPRGQLPVSLLAAPTFGADGRQELVLTLYVGDTISGAEIARRGAALAAAANAVTEAAGGKKPEAWTGYSGGERGDARLDGFISS